ncbi:MAG: DUF1622 domain-containing protein [Rhizobiales bacterium]|nr:DUF1622 domain-containing protein [Hyphomicrobiales bacterium]
MGISQSCIPLPFRRQYPDLWLVEHLRDYLRFIDLDQWCARQPVDSMAAPPMNVGRRCNGTASRTGIWTMNSASEGSPPFETATSYWIHLIGVGIEIFGVFIIVVGIIWSARYLFGRGIKSRYDSYKISIGRSLLLGLEVLVAADIVKTIAIELTFVSLGLLAGLVLVRTFLGWTLTLEIEGRWPWQREPAPARQPETSEEGQVA